MTAVNDTDSKIQSPAVAKKAPGASDAQTEATPKTGDKAQVGAKLLSDTPFGSQPQAAKPADVKVAVADGDGGYPYPAITLVSDSSAAAVSKIEADMQKYLRYFAAPPLASGQPDEQAIALAAKQLSDDNGQFGKDARALYAKYIDWLQKADGPELLRQLENKGLPLPPGVPSVVSDSTTASNENKTVTAADLIRQKSLASDVRFDLKIDPNRVPGADELDKLQRSMAWMTKASDALLTADQKIADGQMVQDLKSLGFSNSFLPPPATEDHHNGATSDAPDDSLPRWRQNTELTLDLAHEMRRYSEATLSLRDAGYYDKLHMPLPPGVTENPPGKLNYDLPTDPRMDTPDNQARLKAFADWKQQYGNIVDQTLMKVEMSKLNPDQMLMWGDIELQNEVGVFKNGVFQSLAKRGSYTPKPDETVQDVSLMHNRFDVRSERDPSGKETIVVSQSMQAQDVASWGYQNMVGVKDVGQPYQTEQRFKPEDFVPISTPDGMKLIQARDLADYKFGQKFELYGGKALIGTMDGAMFVSSLIGVGEVAAGARVLLAGGELAAKVTAEDLAVKGAELGLRLTVAAAGTFNNAGAKDTSWGRTINQLRGYYFMADIALGAGVMQGVKNIIPDEGAAAAYDGIIGSSDGAGQRFDAFMRMQLAKSPLLSAVNDGTKWAFRVTEYGMVPPIVQDNITQIKRIFGQHQNDTLSDAWRFLSDGSGLQLAKSGDFAPKNTDALKATDNVLSNYESVLSRGRSASTTSQVQEIFDKTKEALRLQSVGDPKAAAAKAALITQLLSQEQLHSDDILALNNYIRNNDSADGRMAGRPLSADDLNDLYAGKIPDWIDVDRGPHLLKMVKDQMSKRDQDVSAAGRIALLYLVRDKDGKLPDSLGSVTKDLPRGIRNDDWSDNMVQTYKGQLSIKTADLISNLKAQLETGSTASVDGANAQAAAIGSNRGLAIGDVLTRLGAVSYQQYAGILEDVLSNPHASKDDKLQAMLGGEGVDFATLVTAIKTGEATGSLDSFGVGARELLTTLDNLASNAKEDPDVRGLAAILRFGLTPENASVLPSIVAAARKALTPTGTVPPGALAASAAQYLQYRAVNTPQGIEADESEYSTRLAAASSLRLLAADQPSLAATAAQGFAEIALNSRSPQLQARAYDELVKARHDNSGKTYDIDNLKNQDPDLSARVLTNFGNLTEKQVSSALAAGPLGSVGSNASNVSLRLLASIPGLADKLSPEQKRTLAASLQNQYASSLADQSATQIAVKEAALQAMAVLDPQGSLTTLVAAAALSSKAGGEPNADVRQSALAILNRLHYAKMSELLSKLSKSETDAAVKKTIADLQYIYKSDGGTGVIDGGAGDANVGTGVADAGNQATNATNTTKVVNQAPKSSADFIDAEQATSSTEARRTLENTQAILELAEKGDATASDKRKILIAQLVAQEQFTTEEIDQMDSFLRQAALPGSGLDGRALSAADLNELYAGKTPGWLIVNSKDPGKAKQLVDMAQGFVEKGDAQAIAARRVSLLALLRQPDGSLPDVIGMTNVDFPYPPAAGLVNQTYSQSVTLTSEALVTRINSDLSHKTPLNLSLQKLVEPLLPGEANDTQPGGKQSNDKQSNDKQPLTAAQTTWLQDRFPILLGTDYAAQAIAAGDDSMPRWRKLFNSSETIEQTGMAAIAVLSEEREREWNDLVQLAMSPVSNEQSTMEDISTAKAILFSALNNGGSPLGTAGSGTITWGTHKTGTEPSDPLFNPGAKWQLKAAQALALASQPGVVGRDQVEAYIKEALVDGKNIPDAAMSILLKAWRQYYSPLRQLSTNPGAGSAFVSMSEYSQVIKAAYTTELQKQKRGMGTDSYYKELADAMSEQSDSAA